MRDRPRSKTIFIYDDPGRLVTNSFPDQNGQTIQRSTAYDLMGRKVAEIDENGIVTGYTYDALGRLLFVTNAFGTAQQARTQYGYDELGNLVNQLDANQHLTTFQYDAVGRRTGRTLPSNKSETTQYVVTGNDTLEVTHVDFNNHTTVLDHDVMGRLLTKSIPIAGVLTPVVQFAYYPKTGLRQTMTDPSGATSYTYDDMDRLLTKIHPTLGTLTYTYDLAGNVLTLKSSHNNLSVSQQGVSLTYHWDELNRLVQVDDAAGNSTAYDYDKVGNLSYTAYPTSNPITNTYTYNCLNRLARLNVTKTTGGSTATLATFNYNPDPGNPLRRLDPAGMRRVAVETVVGTTINREVQYSYDALYRLVKENIVSGSPSGAIVYDNSGGYVGYDNVGNRRSRQVPPALQSAALTDFNNASFNSSDQIGSSTYDFNGNTTAETLPPPAVSPTGAHPDQYDFEDRLTQRSDGTTTIQLVYDGDGNRVKRSVNGAATFYLVDDRNPSGYAQVVEDMAQTGTDGSGNPLLEITRLYNYGHSLINEGLWSGSAWQPYYYGYDGHGNVRFLAGSDGAIVNTYTYDAFGILISQTGSTPNNYLYSGEQFDFDLGEYYLRARYYNPGTGRFWTADKFEGYAQDPPSLHRYLYCKSDPVDERDPSGNGEDTVTKQELEEALQKGGQAAVKGVASALKAIGTLGTQGGASVLSGVLKGVGPSLFTSFLHARLQKAMIGAGQRIQLLAEYAKARAGANEPIGLISSVAASGPNMLLVPFGDESEKPTPTGIAPVSIVFNVDGVNTYLLCYVKWHDMPNNRTILTLYPSYWNGTQMVPDYNNPVPFQPAGVFRGIWSYSVGPVYHIEIENPVAGL